MRVLLLVLLLLPLAHAQVEVLTDDEGDATAQAAGTNAPVQTASFDLVALSVEESEAEFRFTLRVQSLSGDNPTPEETGRYVADFTHADQPYRIQFYRDTLQGTAFYDAELQVFDAGRGSYVRAERLEYAVDEAAGTMTAVVARDDLLDGNGTAPTVGRQFDLFRAFSQSQGLLFGVDVSDAMPDSGFGTQPYDIQFGLAQRGHAMLLSDNPVRASNGEKGTFVFYVDAVNLDTDEDRFDLSTDGVPEGWEVTLPASTIRIDENRSRTFPVLVSIPFQHQHGAFESFVLRMDSQRDDSQGQIQIGIRYLEVPQPAGHHDELFFHSRPDTVRRSSIETEPALLAFMNTLETYDGDSDEPVPPRDGQFRCCGQWHWEIPLEPGLQMGLDFDTSRTGYVSADFQADANIDGVTLHGGLWHLEGGREENGEIRGAKETLLAQIVEGTPQSISGTKAFEATLQPTNASDLIPYAPDAAMVLRLELRTDSPVSTAVYPSLVQGQMQLPLNEYRDDIEGVFNSLAGLAFRYSSPSERLVNPGETALFNLTLRNEGAVDDVFALRVNGTNADWARLLGDEKILVRTGTERLVAVAVTPPPDAPDGDIIDLIVTAASEAEPTVQGNIRIVATVDTTLDHPDDSHLIQDVEKELTSKKKSPGLPLVAVLAVLAIWMRR